MSAWRGAISFVLTFALAVGTVPVQAFAESLDGVNAIGVGEVDPSESVVDAGVVGSGELEPEVPDDVAEEVGPIEEVDRLVENDAGTDPVLEDEEEPAAVEDEDAPLEELCQTAEEDAGDDIDGTTVNPTGPMDASEEGLTLSTQSATVSNPRNSGTATIWDCVWLGSYPQTEVTSADAVYNKLQSAGWDSNGDATVAGNKYRRITQNDANSDSMVERYFRYEPVKWRVLEVSGSSALVVSEVSLDDQRYNTDCAEVTWETSAVRSWLNGYGAASNQPGMDFSSKNFIDAAFSSEQKSAILQATVENEDNQGYGTSGGNTTHDKVFLLAESDVCGAGGVRHGFVSDYSTYDKARQCRASDYAYAMGVFAYNSGGTNNCWWWLRSPGYNQYYAAGLYYDGSVIRSGHYVDNGYGAVRPALNLNLTSFALSYAGTVSSDGSSTPAPERVSVPKATNRTYNGKMQIGVPSGVGYTLVGTASATSAGTYQVVARPATNRAWIDGTTTEKTISWRIARASVAVPKATNRTYNGKAQVGVAAGAGYKLSGTAKATAAGTYTAKATPDANHRWPDGTTGAKALTWKVGKAASSVKLAAQTRTYTGKALAYTGKVARSGSAGKVTYRYFSDAKCTKAVKAANVKAAKTYYVRATLAADANHKAATSAAAKLVVAKARNPIAATAVTRTAKLATVKKRAVTVARPMSVSKARGKVTYAKVAKGSAKCLTVNKSTGKVAVKRGTKKGTYKIKIKVTAAGNANYKAGSKTVVCKVTVK